MLSSVLTCGVIACNEAPAPPAARPAPNLVAPAVTWPASSSLDRRALGGLGVEARASVVRSPVPVLVPGATDLSRASLIVEPEYYALSVREDGVTVVVQATRSAHRHEGVGPVRGDRRVRGTDGFVTENEGIRSASWTENGIAYSVDLECETPSDARCASDALVLSLVEGLVFVGGGGR